MKKDRKIEILKERIRLLTMENEQLYAENERLNNRITAGSCMTNARLEQENELLEYLESRKAEYESLIAECVQVRDAYREAADQMKKEMREYRSDVKDVRMGQGTARWRKTFG